MDFILASGSVSRRAILERAGVPFRAIAADVDERGLTRSLLAAGTLVTEVALHLAEAKARAVAERHPDLLILGADQTLVFEGEIVSKCADIDTARALLRRLRGREHRLVGAVAFHHGPSRLWHHVETSRLVMRDFTPEFLDAYLAAEGEGVLSAVGCYKLEGLGAQLFETVEGDYFSILGLPLQPVLARLRDFGVLQA